MHGEVNDFHLKQQTFPSKCSLSLLSHINSLSALELWPNLSFPCMEYFTTFPLLQSLILYFWEMRASFIPLQSTSEQKCVTSFRNIFSLTFLHTAHNWHRHPELCVVFVFIFTTLVYNSTFVTKILLTCSLKKDKFYFSPDIFPQIFIELYLKSHVKYLMQFWLHIPQQLFFMLILYIFINR